MLAQLIALVAAISYALSFILSKRALRYSPPITMTFVSLLLQTIVLFAAVLGITGVPFTVGRLGSKLIFRDVEKITARTVTGAVLVVCGTLAITFAAP